MTDVQFFLLDADQASAERFAAKLTQNAFRNHQTVHIHCQTAEATHQFSQLLWQYSQSSFLANEMESENAPISLGHHVNHAQQFQTLICYENQIPEFFSRFATLQFVVPSDEASKQLAREHYRFFKKRGHPLQHKTITHANF